MTRESIPTSTELIHRRAEALHWLSQGEVQGAYEACLLLGVLAYKRAKLDGRPPRECWRVCYESWDLAAKIKREGETREVYWQEYLDTNSEEGGIVMQSYLKLERDSIGGPSGWWQAVDPRTAAKAVVNSTPLEGHAYVRLGAVR